ncbi:MAG TPA: UDP-glucose/GDP-mannose dehydrogenase family protein [Pirellulales bacterium]|jgi:UDPglucose 6-dehydrogenase|nr:UDP-glucose/GDP-mannose dehydrogenase family protein [Pirellulales bacterium]
MKIAVVGTGYVGLVTGACLADSGNEVSCIDIDREKIERLTRGEIPIYEPGLEELVTRNHEARRLHFTTDLAGGVRASRLVFLAVGTPPAGDGSADLSSLRTVVEQTAPHLAKGAIVVTKSTVPVGTCAWICARLKDLTGRDCDVASNPEFLKEGAAIEDFMKPDRVVVGVRRPEVAEVLRGLYAPFLRTEKPFLVMSPESAEMTKYVANALLSTKISFINEVANLCERMAADIDDVRRGIGHDSRIGFAFLFPGVGYGGSCFPKDVQALAAMARQHQLEPRILQAVHDVNLRQKSVLGHKIARHFGGSLLGRTIAVWGLAFKPRTDDVRDAPSLVLIDRLLELGAAVRVHDPEAMDNVRRLYGDKLQYAALPLDALAGADALAIVTEWGEFRHPDFDEMAQRMKGRAIFDGRNLYDPAAVRAAGFTYHCIGKAPVTPGEG